MLSIVCWGKKLKKTTDIPSSPSFKVCVQGQSSHDKIIRDLLLPWDVTFGDREKSDVEIVCGGKPREGKKTLVIPSDSTDFVEWVERENLRIVKKRGSLVSVETVFNRALEIVPRNSYLKENSSCSSAIGGDVLEVELDGNAILLEIDIIEEYRTILNRTMNAKASYIYSLLTNLPLPYNVAPQRIKNFLMRQYGQQGSVELCKQLPLDALRFALVHALERLCGHMLSMRRLKTNKKYVCILTHDVETIEGLQNARLVKKMEERYDISSTWYVPSRSYAVDAEILKELANGGEVGSHDTVHDGKLIYLSGEDLAIRLCESKKDLEKKMDLSVKGFRAPLLQHTSNILEGVRNAGYTYDSSIPTWEPKHPRTMRPHGLGTIYPIFLNGLMEIPVTAVQDHQLLHILGLRPKEMITYWLDQMSDIKALGGCCVLLAHPDYALLQKSNLAVYEELLSAIQSDSDAWVTTPKNLVTEVWN